MIIGLSSCVSSNSDTFVQFLSLQLPAAAHGVLCLAILALQLPAQLLEASHAAVALEFAEI